MKKEYLFFIFLFFVITKSHAQSHKEIVLIDSLSKKWKIDSIEVKENKMRFAAPENIKDNFLNYKKDMTFTLQDGGILVKGKWKLDLDNRGIINHDTNNSSQDNDVIFNIIQLTGSKLAITSAPASGGQIILHYISTKE